MITSPLPLQSLLLRSTITTLENRIRLAMFKGTTAEVDNEVVNPNTFTWTLQYKPLTSEERIVVLNFLASIGYSKYFYLDVGCDGQVTTYTSRVTPDSLSVTRIQGKYIIKFEAIEQIYGLPVTLTYSDPPVLTLPSSSAAAGTIIYVTIENYGPTFIYETSINEGWFEEMDELVEWTLPSIVADGTVATMTMCSTEPGKYKSSQGSVNVTIVAIEEDQGLVYADASMSDFVTLTDVLLSSNTLVSLEYDGSAESIPVVQDAGETDFKGLVHSVEGNEDFEVLWELSSIDTASTIDTLVTDTPIKTGDLLAIIRDDDTVTSFSARPVTGTGPYTSDTSHVTLGEIPTRIFVLTGELYFKLSGGYQKAVINGLLSLPIVVGPILAIKTTYKNLVDIGSTREITTKVVFKSIGDSVYDIRTTIAREIV